MICVMNRSERSAPKKSLLRDMPPAGSALVLGVCWGLLVMPSGAQERYRLETDKTWKPLTHYEPDTPEGQLQSIRKLLAQNRGDEALEAADAWIEGHPNHTMLAEAHLLRGDARVQDRDYYQALFDYEYVVRQFPDSEQFHTALEREFKIGRIFESGMKRKLWGMRILKADEEAEELFIRIQERAPGSRLGSQASMALGDYYFNRAEMSSAAEAYDLYLTNYPRSDKRQQAMLQLIRANLATFKGPRFDASGLIEADERLKTYEREFPADAEKLGAEALVVRINESLALKDFYTGRWYERRGEHVSAMTLYQRVARDYPQTTAAGKSLERHKRIESRSPLHASAAPVRPPTAPVEEVTP
jgi:outer membrane assembly lipoprotein YfiO